MYRLEARRRGTFFRHSTQADDSVYQEAELRQQGIADNPGKARPAHLKITTKIPPPPSTAHG